MSGLRFALVALVNYLALQCLFAAPVQGNVTVAVSPIKPLQTELIAPLDISRVHVGAPVLARVDVDWSESGCILRAGSIVQGHVVAVTKRSKSTKDSELQLMFDAAGL